MNDILGANIMRLRKEKNMTQEQLANELGISYQAVSKWETGNSCPDISTLPLLADLFEVSIDELFGREAKNPQEPERVPKAPAADVALPWPDDNTLHAVLFVGHSLVGHDGGRGESLFSRKQIQFQYEGPALNVQSDFTVHVDGVIQGNVNAGGDVNCEAVYGGVRAGGDVNCDDVGGGVEAAGDVNCDDVGGAVNAGGDVNCDRVIGTVNAGGDVNCEGLDGGKGLRFHVKI